jgi:hypothetical protein
MITEILVSIERGKTKTKIDRLLNQIIRVQYHNELRNTAKINTYVYSWPFHTGVIPRTRTKNNYFW